MACDDDDSPPCPTCLPAWLATFADLMSLLMCFFVLLLSFSEMDVLKYKQLAGSMAAAFGVQNTINAKDIPKGTSIIAQEFSPGRPEPTPIVEVKQSTTDKTQANMDISCPVGETDSEAIIDVGSGDQSESDNEGENIKSEASAQASIVAVETERTATSVASSLIQEVKKGQIEVETDGSKIVIRIKENGSFASGTASLRPAFIPIMARVRDVLRGIPGLYTIEGHTDNLPINTARFRSNWELSSSRAVSVLDEMLVGKYLEERRFTVVGYGSTRPLVPNTTVENRSKNRRVEIVIEQGKEPDWEEFKIYDSENVRDTIDEIRELEMPPTPAFDEDEIF